MKRYSCILFDLDGTLTYSHPGIYASIRYALSRLGYPEPDEKSLRKCVGPPLTYAFSEIFGLPEERVPLAVAAYRERYSAAGWRENEPVPGAAEALKTLSERGYRLAMATSKPEIFARRISDEFGFTPWLETLAGSGTDGSFPRKEDVIREALRRLNAPPAEALMVGDRMHDAEGASACGVDFAGLEGGYAEPGELAARPHVGLFADFRGLLAFLP